MTPGIDPHGSLPQADAPSDACPRLAARWVDLLGSCLVDAVLRWMDARGPEGDSSPA
jgi:hypothetical protein